jgi:hypothetical protein
MKVINLRLNQHSVEKFFGSVVQWIVFQIPILKMQVRFLPGLLVLRIRHTKYKFFLFIQRSL